MKIIPAILACLFLGTVGVQAQAAKEPVQVLYHGQIHTFSTPSREEKVEVWLPVGTCRIVVNGQMPVRFIRKGETEGIFATVPSPKVRCNEGVGQLVLLTNSLPPGWKYLGGVPIPRG